MHPATTTSLCFLSRYFVLVQPVASLTYLLSEHFSPGIQHRLFGSVLLAPQLWFRHLRGSPVVFGHGVLVDGIGL